MNSFNEYKKAENGLYLPHAKKEARAQLNPKLIHLIKGFKDRSQKEIDSWRKALQFTELIENPRFQPYHDLIDDLLTDAHLQSQIGLRMSATLNTDFHIINSATGQENETLTHLFQQQWFFELLECALWQRIRGFKIIEFTAFGDTITFKEIPQRHLIPTEHKIIPDLSDYESFIDVNDPALSPWLLQIGKPEDLGLINAIVPALIWKRNVQQSWAEFCERFGIPMITANANVGDEKTLNKVHEMLIGLGEASVGTFPIGTEVKFHEANRTDVYKVYYNFINLNTAEISKQLLGSATLSDSANNRSQTEVHERGLDNKIAMADKRSLQFVVNNQLLPILQQHGYAVGEQDEFRFKAPEEKVNLENLWNITNGLLSQGFSVDSDWISKTFHIPLSEEKKKINPIKTQANNVYGLENRYPTCGCCQHLPSAGVQAVSKQLIALTRELAQAMFSKQDIKRIIARLIATEAGEWVKALRKNFGSSKSYTGPDKLVMQIMEYNCYDFAGSKTEARHFAVASKLIDYKEKRLSSQSEFITAALKENAQLNTNYLRTEYNLAVSVGQNSAAYLRAMAEKDTVTPFVEYQTAGDDHVRSSHQVLDGKIFNLNDKSAMQLWPPNGYGCRCEMIPYVGSPTEVTEGGKGKALLSAHDPHFSGSSFEVNRGDLRRVFTQKQFYKVSKTKIEKKYWHELRGYPENLNEMDFTDYGLEPWQSIKGKYKNLRLDQSITGDNVSELFKPLKGKDEMGFSDYLGRKMILTQKNFKQHTTGKYLNESEQRHRLFPHVKDVLKSPDEVWLFKKSKKQKQVNYVKLYGNQAVIVNTTLNEKMEAVEINTWYKMIEKEEKNERMGLLIKKEKDL